jgi:selT/selW/selH-like putative selenoprotein
LEARIRDEFPGTDVELIESRGGVFEVVADGRLIHSKKQTGRHPSWDEVRDRLKAN